MATWGSAMGSLCSLLSSRATVSWLLGCSCRDSRWPCPATSTASFQARKGVVQVLPSGEGRELQQGHAAEPQGQEAVALLRLPPRPAAKCGRWSWRRTGLSPSAGAGITLHREEDGQRGGDQFSSDQPLALPGKGADHYTWPCLWSYLGTPSVPK